MFNQTSLSLREARAIGAYIRFMRKKKHLTQEQVCEGICSVTYLSKIETGKVIPNPEIIDHLYERLGVTTNSDLKLDFDHLKITLYECRQAFDNVNYPKAEELYQELNKFEDYFQQEPEFFHQFRLLTFYHRLVTYKMDEAALIFEELSNIVDQFNQEKQLQFYNYAGIYYGIKQDYSKSLEMLLKAEDSMEYLQKKNPHLMLHLALTYSHLKNSVMAIFYANQALTIFDSELLYLKSIDCKMIIGISYTRSGNYHAAEKVFKNIYKLGDSLGLNTIRALALHNLAFNYGFLNNKPLAKEAYLNSLSFREENDPKIADTTLYLIDILIEEGNYEDAKTQLNKLQQYTWLTKKSKIEMQLAWYKLNHKAFPDDLDDEMNYINYLQEIVIPHYQSMEEKEFLKKKYKELGEYFYRNRKYKLSSQYLLKLTET
ncbi:helix-turn-helix domain-containing protein [Jeotgalibacillus soli]|uniref:HTH cro/C1-type domain-containing protein n=1 Tax=Jeotgalibacillus soli TaxID=889306 RepID=A0A0C2R8Y9_9BACL|nr:helix-turn-helix transcriptional regulator [Jeotgalibacillus soli]KIL46765.1 hypothetical protein KP78_18830 [Jeotgalibacillus soli]